MSFEDVDPETDYAELPESEGWDSDLARREALIEEISDEGATTEAGERSQTEGQLAPVADSSASPKRFLLKDPESTGSIERIVSGLLEDQRYAVVREIVDEPSPTRELWEEQLTPRERVVLHDLCLQFVRADQIIDPELVAQARMRQAEMRGRN